MSGLEIRAYDAGESPHKTQYVRELADGSTFAPDSPRVSVEGVTARGLDFSGLRLESLCSPSAS